MASTPIRSPVVVDGVVNREKVAQLLSLGAEYPELDFKSRIDPGEKAGTVQLAKHVGAMRVKGGYIVLGVDDRGTPTGAMDDVDERSFDEANLAPKLERYLEGIDLRVQVFTLAGKKVVLLCVLPSPDGCTFFKGDGKYTRDDGKEVVAFREGDVFWRDGTRSVRITRQGFEEVIKTRIEEAKAGWLEEQHGIRRREVELDEIGETTVVADHEQQSVAAGESRGRPPLDHLNLELDPSDLARVTLDLARDGDTVGFSYLLNEGVARARALIEGKDLESGLTDLLDRLTCLAATLLIHEQDEWFDRVVQALVKIYALAFGEGDVRRFGYSTHIDPQEVGPRVWLAVIERVFALGGLATRLERWEAVRTLTLQLPKPLIQDGYDKNWLRHALTMASRADHLQEERGGGQKVSLSLLSLARNVVARLECLRPDGVQADDDGIFTDLAQFDLLSSLIAIDATKDTDGRVFYPNFARFRQERIQPIADRIVTDRDLRGELFENGDEVLAQALVEVGSRASSEGWRFDGFEGWERTLVAAFVVEQLSDGK
jgi:Putative DNA-binding domain